MSRILTLENMHTVKMCKRFNYRAFNWWQRVVAKYGRQFFDIEEDIYLNEIYDEFAAGKHFPEIREKLLGQYRPIDLNDITNAVLMGECFYRAVHPGIQGFNREGVFKVLCDENMSAAHDTDGARRAFGLATHIFFEGLTGDPDVKVWDFARNFDFILSKDRAQKDSLIGEERDLTNCAYDAWKSILYRNGGMIDDEIRSLPIIIHIKDGQASGRDVKKLLKKHKDEILRLAGECKSPVIVLDKRGKPKIGTHYLELIDGTKEEKTQELINMLFKRFLRDNPLGWSSEKVVTEHSTIREMLERDVKDWLSSLGHEPETYITALNDALSNINDHPILSEDRKMYLTRQETNRTKRGYKQFNKIAESLATLQIGAIPQRTKSTPQIVHA